MQQAARVQSAIDIMENIAEARIPMDNTIRDFMSHKRYIGSKDRKFIVELVYDSMRAHARLGWWLERVKIEDTPRARAMAFLVLTGQDITNLFTGENHQPAPLSDEEQRAAQELRSQDINHADMPENISCECPDWAAEKLKPIWKDDFKNQMQAMMPPAVMDLRVNTIKVTREQAKASLAKDDVETIKTPYSPFGLRAVGKPYMSATKAFHKGLVEIQDEGSQLIALMCDVKPGMRVLDYCAGSGGKTLGIAAMMEGKGIIYATDNSTRRLEKGRRRYKKADIHNVEVRSLEEEKNRKWLRRQKGAIDVVLVDAPCSSSGTWRRNPDYRWNTYGPSLEEIVEIQSEILERVADKVKVGGRLVYATCSLFTEENEEQIEKFLAKHDEYEIIPVTDIWNKDYGECPVTNHFMRLTPKDHKTDGFFTAVLKRIK